MAKLGPLDVICDAPPYPIVQACRQIGMKAPEDVRWDRLSTLLNQNLQEGPFSSLWTSLLPRRSSGKVRCICGGELPVMEEYVFTFARHGDLHMLLGQCQRCRTIIWES